MEPNKRRFLIPTFLLVLALTLSACETGFFRKAPEFNITPLSETFRVNPDGIWFDDLQGERAWTDVLYRAAVEYLIDSLVRPEKADAPPGFMLEDEAPAIVFLSLSNGRSPAHVFYGGGNSVLSAFNAMLVPGERANLPLTPETWIKIDIVNKVHYRSGYNPEDDLVFERRLYGIALEENSGIALLPAELVAQTIIDRGHNFQLGNLRDYLIKRNKPQASIASVDDAETINIFRFDTHGYFYDGDQLFSLIGGHRQFANLSEEQLLESITLGGNYLQKAMQENGKFVYEYLPKSDTVKPEYNILRHAGTLYAMTEVYELNHDPELLKVIEMGISYLIEQLAYCETQDGREFCFVEQDEVKLGANGIGLVALTKYTEVTGDRQFLSTMQSLARWILAVQTPEGEFTIHKLRYSTGEVSDFISAYYPGEALLGLIRLYQLDDNPIWADAAEKGARWLIEVRDGEADDTELQHDHWLMYALNEIHRSRPNDVFLEHTSRLARIIIEALNDGSQVPDWRGSIYVPPKSTPTATRGEGLNAAYRLLRDYGSQEEAEAILTALEDVIRFELYTQIYGEKAMYFDNPQRVYGAFHEDLTDYSIRIDFVQHNISSVIGFYQNQKD
ncbi:MAG: hypothetical protein ACOCYU_03890 [Brevefilum sp.]